MFIRSISKEIDISTAKIRINNESCKKAPKRNQFLAQKRGKEDCKLTNIS
jgi:hypothetical protein